MNVLIFCIYLYCLPSKLVKYLGQKNSI